MKRVILTIILAAIMGMGFMQDVPSWITERYIVETKLYSALTSEELNAVCSYLGTVRDEVLFAEFEQAYALYDNGQELNDLLNQLDATLVDLESAEVNEVLNLLNATVTSSLTIAGIVTATATAPVSVPLIVLGVGSSSAFLLADAVRVSIYHPDDATYSLIANSGAKVNTTLSSVGGTGGNLLSGAGVLFSLYNFIDSLQSTSVAQEQVEKAQQAIETLRAELGVSASIFEAAKEDPSDYIAYINYQVNEIDNIMSEHCR